MNLKNDIIFKAFFSKKGNEKYLIDFLNSILKIEITKIEIKDKKRPVSDNHFICQAVEEEGKRRKIHAKM